MYADNVALPAFACRAAGALCISRSIYPAGWATDGRTLYRFIDPALHTVQALPVRILPSGTLQQTLGPNLQNILRFIVSLS